MSPTPVRRRICSPSRGSRSRGGSSASAGSSHSSGKPYVAASLGQPRVRAAVEESLAFRIAAVVRTADDAVPGVVVAVGRVDVELREPQRALPPPPGRGHAQEVQQQQAFALVEPVVAAFVLVVQHAQLGQLPGDAFPVPLRLGEQVVGAAEQVQLGPVEERLVEVVDAVAGGEPVVVGQPSVRPGEVAGEPAPGLVEQVEQLALGDRPARWFEQGHRGRDDGVHRLTPWSRRPASPRPGNAGRTGRPRGPGVIASRVASASSGRCTAAVPTVGLNCGTEFSSVPRPTWTGNWSLSGSRT